MSYMEEALARSFVEQGVDASSFLEKAKFWTTKMILSKDIE